MKIYFSMLLHLTVNTALGLIGRGSTINRALDGSTYPSYLFAKNMLLI